MCAQEECDRQLSVLTTQLRIAEAALTEQHTRMRTPLRSMQQSTLADARVRHITDPTSNPDHTSLAQENAKAAAVAELSASAEAALQRDLERAVRNLELEVRAREALEATLEASAEDRACADRSLDHAAEEISNLQAEVSNVRNGLASREQELARRYQVCAL